MKWLTLVALAVAASSQTHAQITDAGIAELYARPSPFEKVPRERWIAESENAYAIRDGNPQAPFHFLVIPKKRIPTLLQASPGLLGELLGLARRVAEEQGLAREGFRIVINTHPDGGQHVYHLHVHVLGGRPMRWPPG